MLEWQERKWSDDYQEAKGAMVKISFCEVVQPITVTLHGETMPRMNH